MKCLFIQLKNFISIPFSNHSISTLLPPKIKGRSRDTQPLEVPDWVVVVRLLPSFRTTFPCGRCLPLSLQEDLWYWWMGGWGCWWGGEWVGLGNLVNKWVCRLGWVSLDYSKLNWLLPLSASLGRTLMMLNVWFSGVSVLWDRLFFCGVKGFCAWELGVLVEWLG